MPGNDTVFLAGHGTMGGTGGCCRIKLFSVSLYCGWWLAGAQYKRILASAYLRTKNSEPKLSNWLFVLPLILTAWTKINYVLRKRRKQETKEEKTEKEKTKNRRLETPVEGTGGYCVRCT